MADSLTISPIGFTYHVLPNEFASAMPNRFTSGLHPITYHPEINLIYKQKYMQYSLFWMKDSRANDSFGLLIGPKYDLIDDVLSIGGVIGPYLRDKESESSKYQIGKINHFNLLPFYSGTIGLSYPGDITPELNLIINHVVIHLTVGVKFKF